jgi:hypothetical protein
VLFLADFATRFDPGEDAATDLSSNINSSILEIFDALEANAKRLLGDFFGLNVLG